MNILCHSGSQPLEYLGGFRVMVQGLQPPFPESYLLLKFVYLNSQFTYTPSWEKSWICPWCRLDFQPFCEPAFLATPRWRRINKCTQLTKALSLYPRYMPLIKRTHPLEHACNLHTRPIPWHFYRPVYFRLCFPENRSVLVYTSTHRWGKNGSFSFQTSCN